MSAHKKNSISYTIPADSDSEDESAQRRSHRERIKKNEVGHSSQMNPMHQMNSMMNSMLADPFGMFDGFGGMGRRQRGQELMPFGFPNMNNIFQNFQMDMNSPNCHSFSSSTIMTMSSGPDGRPQVYQASQSTRTAPGGIRETKKSVCDSRTGTKKLAIGHHIGDRSHIKEREQNIHSGQQEEREEFINLEEDEAANFNQEWETRIRSGMNAIGYDQPRIRNRRQRPDDIPAILDRYRPRSRITSRRYPAISSSSSSEVTKEEEKEKEEDKEQRKGKKRSQEEKEEEEDEDDAEEARKKSCKVIKSSQKKKH